MKIQDLITRILAYNLAVVISDGNPTEDEIAAATVLAHVIELDKNSAEYVAICATLLALDGFGYLNIGVEE